MTVEYLVLGVVVLLVAVGQIYFRHFAGSDDPETPGRRQVPTRSGKPAGRFWEGWTAILGFIGAALAIALIVLGILGR
jgi:hypothetical protein